MCFNNLWNLKNSYLSTKTIFGHNVLDHEGYREIEN